MAPQQPPSPTLQRRLFFNELKREAALPSEDELGAIIECWLTSCQTTGPEFALINFKESMRGSTFTDTKHNRFPTTWTTASVSCPICSHENPSVNLATLKMDSQKRTRQRRGPSLLRFSLFRFTHQIQFG